MKTSHNIVEVSRETLLLAREAYHRQKELHECYLDELLWWNRKLNLVSRDVSRETLREHVIHSLLPSVLHLLKEQDLWVDAGTGGGLPGIPLAIAENNKRWVLNDLVRKKVAAVRQMVYKLELANATVTAGSIDGIEPGSNSGVITRHAFPLNHLLTMLGKKRWRNVVVYKGVIDAQEELRGIDPRIPVILYRFDFGVAEPFYAGKGIVQLDTVSDSI